MKRFEILANEVADPVLITDSVKKLAKAYCLMDQERKPLDVPMPAEEYDKLEDAELDAMEESDDQFLRANGASRALRYIEKLKRQGNHWSWDCVSLSAEEALKQEDGHMAELKKKMEEELKNPPSGGGGAAVMFGKKKSKKKNGLLSMFG